MKFFNFLKILSMNVEWCPSTKQKLTYIFFGAESTRNLGAKLWNKVPENIKSFELLNVFKSKIKYWIPNHCSCRICKTYIGQVGFINQTDVFVESTICLTYLILNDKILKISFKIIVKVFNPLLLKIYLFIVPYNDCTL